MCHGGTRQKPQREEEEWKQQPSFWAELGKNLKLSYLVHVPERPFIPGIESQDFLDHPLAQSKNTVDLIYSGVRYTLITRGEHTPVSLLERDEHNRPRSRDGSLYGGGLLPFSWLNAAPSYWKGHNLVYSTPRSFSRAIRPTNQP